MPVYSKSTLIADAFDEFWLPVALNGRGWWSSRHPQPCLLNSGDSSGGDVGGVSRAKTKSSSSLSPRTAPVLMVYNFFFRYQRGCILQTLSSIDGDDFEAAGDDLISRTVDENVPGNETCYTEILQYQAFAEQVLLEQWSRDPKVKRQHRKSQGARPHFLSILDAPSHRQELELFARVCQEHLSRHCGSRCESIYSRRPSRDGLIATNGACQLVLKGKDHALGLWLDCDARGAR